MATLREYLDSRYFTNRVLIPPDVDVVLRSVNLPGAPGSLDGWIVGNPALPGFLSFTLATGRPVTVTVGGTPADWRADISLVDAGPLFHLPTTPPLVPAEPRSGGTGAARQEWLEPVDGRLRVDGEPAVPATRTTS